MATRTRISEREHVVVGPANGGKSVTVRLPDGTIARVVDERDNQKALKAADKRVRAHFRELREED